MKKIILLVLAISVTLTGCVSRGDGGSSSSSQSSSSQSSSMSSSMAMPQPEEPEMPQMDFSPAVPTLGKDFARVRAFSPTAVTWGPGKQVDDKNRTTACIQLNEKYGKYNANFIGPEDEKVIYLTFDEGYENGFSIPILDVLKEKNVKAVFFVTGHYAKTNPEIVQRMIDDGHYVGNHSWGHLNFTKENPEVLYDDVKQLHDYMLEKHDYTMHLFRYPEGVFSEQSLALMQSMGYQTAFWSFAYSDWDQNAQPDVKDAYNRMVSAAHPGAIYLLHAVSSSNAAALGDVIDKLRSDGYEFKLYDIEPVASEMGVNNPNVKVPMDDGQSSQSSSPSSTGDNSLTDGQSSQIASDNQVQSSTSSAQNEPTNTPAE